MADNKKLDRLRAISSKVPVLNEQAAARIAGGRALQVQQAAKALPAQGNLTRQAQAVAPQIGAQSGAQQLEQQAQAQAQDVNLGQQANAMQAQQNQQQLAQQSIAQKEQLGSQALQQQTALSREQEKMKKTLTKEEIDSAKRVSQLGLETDNMVSFMTRKQREDLARVGADVKQQVFDSRIRFERDENGRKFSNARQMADFAVSSAENEQDLQERMQAMTQANEKEILMLEIAHNKLSTALKNGFLDDERELNQVQKQKLADMQAAMQRDIDRKKRRSVNQKQVIGGAMVVAGVIVTGASFGAATPVGAAMIGAGASYATSN